MAQPADRFEELLVADADPLARVGLVRDVDAHRPGDVAKAQEPAAQAEPGRDDGRGLRGEREVEGSGVQHREQRGHPGRQRFRRTEPDQRQVSGMALRQVGGPAFPPLIQVGQGIDRRRPRAQRVVRAGQQFGAPGGHSGPRVQQRHLVLAPVELRVQRRQVGDLQRDRDERRGRGEIGDRLLRGSHVGAVGSEHRRTRKVERGPQAFGGERPHQQHEPQVEERQPGEQLGHQDGRRLPGEPPVAALVVGHRGRHHVVDTIHDLVHPPGQPAADQPRHDDRHDHGSPRRLRISRAYDAGLGGGSRGPVAPGRPLTDPQRPGDFGAFIPALHGVASEG